jgi:hypothetical protein
MQVLVFFAHHVQVQALLGAQEAAKRQCIDGVLPQEQQPPAQDLLMQQQDNTTNRM